MTPEQQESLKDIVPKLKIIDVVLVGSRFSTPAQSAPESAQGWQQHKRGVQYGLTEPVEDGCRELHVKVELGTRVLLGEGTEDGEAAVQFEIEADFLVRYRIAEEVQDEALDAFSRFNAVHNVWPFWRQHVFDIVQRGRLPHLEVPLFAGVNS